MVLRYRREFDLLKNCLPIRRPPAGGGGGGGGGGGSAGPADTAGQFCSPVSLPPPPHPSPHRLSILHRANR